MEVTLKHLVDVEACMYGRRLFLRAFPKQSVRLTRKNMLLFYRKMARRIGYEDALENMMMLVEISMNNDLLSLKQEEEYWEKWGHIRYQWRDKKISERVMATRSLNLLADSLGLK